MINNKQGRIGVLQRLQQINKLTRTITTNDNSILIATYKTDPLLLQQQIEQVAEIVGLSKLSNEQAEAELKQYTDEVDNLASQLLVMKDDIGYQGLIIEFVTLYPQYKGLFK